MELEVRKESDVSGEFAIKLDNVKKAIEGEAKISRK
jgi:hypothetical protein